MKYIVAFLILFTISLKASAGDIYDIFEGGEPLELKLVEPNLTEQLLREHNDLQYHQLQKQDIIIKQNEKIIDSLRKNQSKDSDKFDFGFFSNNGKYKSEDAKLYFDQKFIKYKKTNKTKKDIPIYKKLWKQQNSNPTNTDKP